MRLAGVTVRKAKAKPYPMLRAAANEKQNAASRTEAATVMLHHFAANEAEVFVTAEELQRTHASTEPLSFRPSSRNIPTILDTVRYAASTCPYKAIGPDGIHPMLEVIAPHEIARHLHPLLVQTATYAREPLIAKGGKYAILGKANSTPEQLRLPEAYRAILLNSRIAKHHHAFLRSRLLNLVDSFHTCTQCCDRPGRGTDIAGFTVRTFWSHILKTEQFGPCCF